MKEVKLAASYRGLCDYCSKAAVVRFGPESKNGIRACGKHKGKAKKDAKSR